MFIALCKLYVNGRVSKEGLESKVTQESEENQYVVIFDMQLKFRLNCFYFQGLPGAAGPVGPPGIKGPSVCVMIPQHSLLVFIIWLC